MVFLTARDSLTDRLTGFELGGDDYITKPFNVAEVVARMNAVLRRGGGPVEGGVRVVADLVMDEQTKVVTRAGRPVDLSPTEFRLLRMLLDNAGRVMSKQQILQQVWHYEFGGDPGAVEKFVSRLRRKVDDDAVPLLHTVRGFGYVLREPPPVTGGRDAPVLPGRSPARR